MRLCLWENVDDVSANRGVLKEAIVEARLLSDLQQFGITGLILVEVVVVLAIEDNFLRTSVRTLHCLIHIEVTGLMVIGFLLLLLPAFVDLGAEEGPTHCCAFTTSYQLAVC